uniref:Lipoprotein n=1 Tax=Caenorhabditis tropicalis TaxID=1561998 RepID=A0A1I7U8I8_9PELO
MRIALILVIVFISFVSSCKNFDKYKDMFCQYGQEKTPCTVQNYASLKAACCAMKGSCSFQEFPKDSVCCFTDDCLKRCYPGKLYKNGQVY